MARLEAVERRLQEWAQWIKVGDGSGYPTRSPLDADWSPPTPGMTPSMKVSAPSSARATHRAIAKLSVRLGNTLVMHYVQNMTPAQQATLLGCGPATVHRRIESAHRQLLMWLPPIK